jgi:hypothetical protein
VRAVIVLTALVLFASRAGADDKTLGQAQEHFRQGVEKLRSVSESRRLFAAAADDFARVQQEGVRTAALYRALGNAEALAGRWPRAIWAYECGLRLDPNDRTLRQHRDYARTLVNYPAGGRGRPTGELWPGWLHRPAPGEWLLAAAIAYSLAWLAGAWWYMRRRTLPWVAILGLAAAAIAALGGWYTDVEKADYDLRHPLAVVAADNTPLYRGNGPNYPLNADVPSLPGGMEVRVLHERGAWLQVQLATGEIGWLVRARVLICG